MPKVRHEAVVEILQNEPELVLQLLTGAGVHLQFGTQVAATIADSNLSDRDADNGGDQVRGLFSDNVFVFEEHGRRIAVVAEVQSGSPDTQCSLSWPAYVANARRRHRCDTLLLVFAITKDAAHGSAKAIRTGHPGWDLIPLISGIGRTPGLPREDTRFGAELVLLRIITRELELTTHDARMFALAVVRSAPSERIPRYTKYLKALAPTSVREPLETLMKTVLKDSFVDGLLNRGRAEMLLELLEMRFSVPGDIRMRVEKCTDETQIIAWFEHAVSASSLDEVFRQKPKGTRPSTGGGTRKASMKTVPKDTFVDRTLDQGHLRGARQMMLQLLGKRFSVPEDIGKRVEECTDIATIDAWFDRAITAMSLDEVFAE